MNAPLDAVPADDPAACGEAARSGSALASLQRERERLAVALRAGRLGVYEWQVGASDVWWSPEIYEVYGVDPRTFTPTVEAFVALVHPEDREELWRKTEDCIARGAVFVHEYRVVPPDGRVRWISNRSHVVVDDEGRPTRITGVATDITERRRAADALRDSEARLRIAIEAARMFSWQVDLATQRLQWSDNAAGILGCRPADLPDDMARSTFFVDPEDEARLGVMFARALADRAETYEWEFRGRPAGDGTVRYWLARGRIDYDRGTPVCVYGVTQDVSEHKRLELTLRESEARFRAMADGLPLIVWVHDAEGCQEFVNLTFCSYFGVSREDMKAHRWRILMHPDDADRYTESFHAAVRTRRPFSAEVRVRRADGEWRWIESWAQPRIDEHGRFLGHVGTSLDVTERKHAYDLLRDADRRKDEFLATLAHELRNPLAPLRNAVELLKRGEAATLLPQLAGMMDRQVTLLVRLIDDLLDLSRVRSGKLELRREPVELAAVLHNAIETTLPMLGRRAFALSLPSSAVVLDGDFARLAQVFGNVLNNACKFTQPDGRITVTAELHEGDVIVTLSDDGIGIAGDKLEHVFEMFAQVAPPLERTHGGLGIGLALVRQIVELHGGSARATSAGPGHGTTIRITLPTLANSPDLAPVPANIQGATRRRTVLVIDDNRDAAESLRMLLEAHGHRAEVALSGADGVDKARLLRPDLILLDIGMPGMNGYEACHALRAQPQGAATCIVALTGWGQESDREKARTAGFDGHLVKPVDVARLFTLLDALPSTGPTA